MIDVDLSQAVSGTFFLFVVVPSLIGMSLGGLLGYFIFAKKFKDRITKLIVLLLTAMIFAILSVVLTVFILS